MKLSSSMSMGSVNDFPPVRGIDLDSQSRCAHYRSKLDIVSIKFKCCGEYYACVFCHDELADHPVVAWPKEQWENAAVMCGSCRHEMTIIEYFTCANQCPACDAGFNPNCAMHYGVYFDID